MELASRTTFSKDVEEIFDRLERRLEQRLEKMCQRNQNIISLLVLACKKCGEIKKSDQMQENSSAMPVSYPEVTTTATADQIQEEFCSPPQERFMEPEASTHHEDDNATSEDSIPVMVPTTSNAKRLPIHVRVQEVKQLRSSQREMICSSSGRSSSVSTEKALGPDSIHGVVGNFMNTPGFIQPFTWVMTIFEEHGPGPPYLVTIQC